MLHGCSYSLDVVVLFAAAFVASALLSGTQKIHRYLHTPYVCYRQKPCMFVDTCNFLPRIVCASRSICASRSRLQSVASASSGLNSSSACRFACCKLAWHSFGAVRASFFAHRILLSCVPSLLRHTPVAVHVYQVPLRLTLQSLSRTNANAKGDTGDSALLRWRWVS